MLSSAACTEMALICIENCYTCCTNSQELNEEEEEYDDIRFSQCRYQRIKNIVWSSLLWATFILLTILLYCWSVFSNDYNDFDWFLYENSGAWFGWGLCILILLSVIFLLIFLLFIFNVISNVSKQGSWKLHISYKVGISVALVIAIAGYIAISKLWNEEWYTAVLALQMMSPFFHIAAVVAFTFLSWLILGAICSLHSRRAVLVSSTIFTVFLFVLYCLPLAVTSPCIKQGISDIPKPKIIGHRGYPTSAPENTIFSYEKAVNSCELYAVETDIFISRDGIPFLMHDYDLRRTTNVEKIFPQYAEYRSDYFTWNQLSLLNAGEWYLETDPFHTTKFISNNDRSAIRNQSIPKLEDLALFLAKHNLSFIFDLRQPPEIHPNRNNFTTLVLNTLFAAGVPPSNILWLPSFNHSTTQQEYPNLTYVYEGEHIDEYEARNNYTMINVNYNLVNDDLLKYYKSMNLSIIEYVITSPWLFSWTWCEGIDIVTSNNCKRLTRIGKPAWQLTPNEYLAIWLATDIASLVCIIIMAFIQYKHRGNFRHISLVFSSGTSVKYML